MNLTIKTKLLLLACLAGLTILALNGIGYFQMKKLARLQDEGFQRGLESRIGLEASHVGANAYQVIADAVINRDLKQTAKDWQQIKENGLKLLGKAYDLANSPEEKEWAENARKAFNQVVFLFDNKQLPLLKASRDLTSEIMALDHEIDSQVGILQENMRKYSDSMQQEAVDADKTFDSVRTNALTQSVVLAIAGLILLILASFWIARSILLPLGRMLFMLQDIAEGEGDLTKRLTISAKDEIGETCKWFNLFIDKLHGIISRVAQNTTQVASAATQLYSTSEQMATGAEEVANQAGTVATASEEMTATTTEIAQNCNMAFQGSQQANDAAVSGAAVVQESVAVMSRIAQRVKESAKTVESLGARSDQIGEIVGTIEDIADQTNLLALNAAIEAARAGEQGRGFAVVADEVRALAERTTKATKEIGQMIKAIQHETKGAVNAMNEGVQEVEKGTSEAARSGEALQAILIQINSVTDQVSQIATAAEEQTATTSEISNNIQQISEVVQETAKGAQESASAASQLARLAEELQRLVGQFKLAV